LNSSLKLPGGGFGRVFRLLFVLFLVLVVVVFMLENEQSVIISVFGRSSPALPVSVCIVVAFLIGAIIGPLLGCVFRRGQKFK